MKVTQEKLPASQIGLEIEITPEMSKKAYEQVLQQFTRSANIPGFRKGKVPRHVLIQRFGSSRIKATVVEELIQDSLKQAIEQEKIDAIGNFELRSSFEELVSQFEPGSTLTFSAAVDVPPEVKLEQYSDLKVQAEEVEYDPDRVDKVLENYQADSATLIPVEGRPAQMGDVAVVDFAGHLADQEEGEEPKEIPGGSAEDFQIELLEGRFIEGFIDGIVGMTVGETKEISAIFPESYPQEDLAGQAAVFTTTLKELKEKELPELNDDFAQEVSDFETLAELRESLETKFQEEAKQKTTTNKEQALLNQLVERIEVEIPETLVKREVDYMLTQTAMQLSNQGLDVKQLFTQEMLPQLRQRSRPEAITRIKRTLALGEIAKRESLKVESAEVEAKVSELMVEYAGQDVDPARLREVVEENLLKEKIMGWLEEHATIELLPEGSLTDETQEGTIEDSQEEVAEEEVSEETEIPGTVDVSATAVEGTEEMEAEDATNSVASTSEETETTA